MIRTLQTILVIATVVHRFVIIYQNLKEENEHKQASKDITPETNRRA
jgi:hypothetical protein